jgi:two-component system response regulator YesN
LTRIILVEDEPLFRKGLAKMITGSGSSWSVCGEAENGQEAERLITELQPDLVITDIRMPLMDGLELLKRVKAKYPDIEFIVITGFQDFQYAQTALRCGAFDLLIKPCSKQDICVVLDKVEVLVREKQARLRKEASEHQLLLENTLRAILLRFPYRMEEAAGLEQLQGFNFLLFQIMDYQPSHKQYMKRDVPLLQFAVLNIISELLDAYGITGHLLLIESGQFALLLGHEAEEQSLCAEACETVQRLLGLTLTSQLAGNNLRLTELADVYEAMKVNAKAAQHTDKSSGVEEVFPINRARQQLISAQTMAFILAGQTDSLKQYLDQLMCDIRCMSGDSWKIEALSLSFALQDTARKQLEQELNPQTFSVRISQLHACSRLDEVLDWMKTEVEQFLSFLFEWQHRYSENAISKAVRYMEEHYSEQLPLQLVASQVHLNATYFSHLFKKETGRSFVDYVIDLRMEKAKKLLSNTNLKVTEVSGMIGYDLPNYFAKLFKQSTGLSPKEYRKLHQN